MVEYAIKDEFHSALLRFAGQLIEGFVTSEFRINFEVILSVIPVIGCGEEDWIKIKNTDPEVL